MLNLEYSSFNTRFLEKSKFLVKVRIGLYSLAYIHLVSVATLLLTIDFSQYDDPDIQMYQNIRFRLITAWFNLVTMVYYPICLYCDWRELQGENKQRHVKVLNYMRHLCFTSILLPATAFGDILFWRVWNTHREMIAPASIHEVVPFWTQHCMHTVSLALVLLDLVLVRRKKPKSNILNVAIMCGFLFAYTVVCMKSYMDGIYIYPGLKQFTGIQIPILIIYMFIENLFYYLSQWLVVDMVWGQKDAKKCV